MIITKQFYKEKTQLNKKYNKYYTYEECWYDYKCNNCGWDSGIISENNLDNGCGCGCCHSLVVVPGINDIPTTAPWMIPYFQGGYDEAKLYTYGSTKSIYPKCPDCGRIKSTPKKIMNIYSDKSIGCICSDNISYPEKLFINIFEQLNLKFQYQLTNTTYKWVGNYRYDFYLLDYNCIIEVHGMQHYKKGGKESAFKTLEEEQENDRLKKDLALKNGIKNYIVIDARYSNINYIKNNIVNNSFFKMFNLNKIDWDCCDIAARKNIFILACQIKKENPEYSTGDIGRMLHLSTFTIYRYLKRGNDLGLCYYNPKEEMSRRSIKNGYNGAYEINVINKDSNKIIATYRSAKLLSENSIKDFGIYFAEEMSRKAAKYNKIYKGYKFKYTKDLN